MRDCVFRSLIALFCGAVLAATAAATSARADNDIHITTLSSRPDTVSGGNVLVRVDFPPGMSTVNVLLNGQAVTAAFRPVGGRGSIMGLVSGLRLGKNTLTAQGGNRNERGHSRSVTLTNYPTTGPIISGPHEEPFFCMTQNFNVPPGTTAQPTLGPALDGDCSVATRVDYVYVSTTRNADGTALFKPLPTTSGYPGDLATTVTSEGRIVPYIVRVETGTIDRGIYQTAILHDPMKEGTPTPFSPPAAWNHRLVYTFGGGCVGGWYIQGRTLGNSGRIGILEDLMLSQGYGMAANSLNVFGNNCADLLAAESMMMTRERFIENFGPVDFTIGYGCSGGSEAQHPISDEYPGLIDGVIVGCSFPEVTAAMINNITDADLFFNYLKNHSELAWSNAQILAATGYPTVTTLATIGPGNAVRVKAQGGVCNAAIPANMIYDRTTNPKGVRCDIYDHMVNVFGRDPATGFARRPIDNVGVQYGLQALNAGAIDKQHFLDLNKSIGGYDNDGNYVATRTVGDVTAVRAAYSSGRITYGGLGMRHTPIIDYRGYVDQPENGNETHSRFHSFSMRQRLIDANGNFDNQVMLVESGFGPSGLFGDNSPVLSHALTQMDEWLTNIKADHSEVPLEVKIARDKPGDLTDACFTNNGTVKIAQEQVYQGNTTCNQLYPAFSTPRMVAGEPLENDVLKCRLKPLDRRDYKVTFTAAEWAELREIFPTGVCNYDKPGVGQEPTDGVWQFFPFDDEEEEKE
jgi:Tannase-like family of unknown function (DUF6351)